MTTPTSVLALIQAAGLPGFRSSEPGAELLNAAAAKATEDAGHSTGSTPQAGADDAEPVLTLIKAAGLAGFKSTSDDT